jgi:hypothetical protein
MITFDTLLTSLFYIELALKGNILPLSLIETEISVAISGLDHWIVTENGSSLGIREEC